jgi:hypothetical protein
MLSRGWPITEALGEVRGRGDQGLVSPHVPMSPIPYVENRSLNHGSAEFE